VDVTPGATSGRWHSKWHPTRSTRRISWRETLCASFTLDVFVQSFPNPGPKARVSTDSVQLCWWAPDGRHLLFLKRDETLWRVDVDLGGALPRIGAPVQLATFPSTLVTMDLAPDGQRFLALVPQRAGLGTVTSSSSGRGAGRQAVRFRAARPVLGSSAGPV